jgi:hypothetical protein
MWFTIKTNPYAQSGAKLIFQTAKLMKEQSNRVQTIVFPFLQRNAYFAHPENILICMISDANPHFREFAWRRKKIAVQFVNESQSYTQTIQVPTLVADCFRLG